MSSGAKANVTGLTPWQDRILHTPVTHNCRGGSERLPMQCIMRQHQSRIKHTKLKGKREARSDVTSADSPSISVLITSVIQIGCPAMGLMYPLRAARKQTRQCEVIPSLPLSSVWYAGGVEESWKRTRFSGVLKTPMRTGHARQAWWLVSGGMLELGIWPHLSSGSGERSSFTLCCRLARGLRETERGHVVLETALATST